MGADIVNLRTARKRKVRAEREAQAAENRARFGQPKSEKQAHQKSSDLDARRLDQAKRDTRTDDVD